MTSGEVGHRQDFCYVAAANATQEGRQEFGDKRKPNW
jgi:hypothetical protein